MGCDLVIYEGCYDEAHNSKPCAALMQRLPGTSEHQLLLGRAASKIESDGRLLQIVDEVLMEASILYWITGGTLLGALRHGGFIPHDDDVDIECYEDGTRGNVIRKGANKLRPSIGEQPAEVPASGKGANKLRTYSGETLPEERDTSASGTMRRGSQESITAPVPTEFWRVASIQDKTQRRCPDWQVFIDGCWRCQPCNKMIDEQHVTTELHKTRPGTGHILAKEKMRTLSAQPKPAQELESCGYKPPELPYLAYVPDEDGSRFLMCLLCRKSGKPKGTWVTDPASHSGTHEMPEGSKEHRRNLQTRGNKFYRASHPS
eukprot:s207_g18.t1